MDRPLDHVGQLAVSTFVVIPCSGDKADVPFAPARQLYTGSYFRLALAAAERVDGAQVFVLSAAYGLVPIDKVIATYDVRMGAPGSITNRPRQFNGPDAIWFVRAQADGRGMREPDARVISLLPYAYNEVLRQVVPSTEEPLDGCRGIGDQRSRVVRLGADGLVAEVAEPAA